MAAPVAAPADGRVRVSKLMAERGLCSRREADSYIERGWVFADGVRITELGTRVDPGARITLSEAARGRQSALVTIILHKPVGYVSAQAEDGYRPAVTLITAETQFRADVSGQRFSPAVLRGLAPAGRLDIDSTGLLVLTQDGRVARQLIGEDSGIEKEYLVRVEGRLGPEGLARLDGQPLAPAKVRWQNEDQLNFVLREGRKRQIRRMCELVGLRVTGLKRIRIGRVRLDDLPQGQWRFLGADEGF
jgi:23S rRNA pseudouridine2604 synthase